MDGTAFRLSLESRSTRGGGGRTSKLASILDFAESYINRQVSVPYLELWPSRKGDGGTSLAGTVCDNGAAQR